MESGWKLPIFKVTALRPLPLIVIVSEILLSVFSLGDGSWLTDNCFILRESPQQPCA